MGIHTDITPYHLLQAPGDQNVPPAQREAPNRLALLNSTELDTSEVDEEAASNNQSLMALIDGLKDVQLYEETRQDREAALNRVRRVHGNRLPEGVRQGM